MTSSIPTSSASVPFKRPPPRVVEVRRPHAAHAPYGADNLWRRTDGGIRV